ncbi:sensor histidine kinase [Actinomadura sp. 21ATH]|uniref:sensor histidine kinase n=1 Tax=Actinomadura sp. 21ATH TaxID=1735444 RepID=UPI0035C0916D
MSRRHKWSIRVRMAVRTGIVTALVSALINVLLIVGIRDQAADYKAQEIATAALQIVSLVERGRAAPVLPPTGDVAIQVVEPAGTVVAATPDLRGRPRIAAFTPPVDSKYSDRVMCPPAGMRSCMRVIAFRTYLPGAERIVYAADEAVPWYLSGALCTFLFAVTLLVSLLTALRTWRTVDHALAPVDDIRRELLEITATESARRVPVPESRDEIGKLAEAANDTLDRLDAALEQQRRFTSDASHDLRSPITAARLQLEEALLSPADSDWPKVGRAVLGSLDRLQAIVNDLLELARLDTAAERPRTAGEDAEPVDLAALVSAELERAPRKGTRVVPRLQANVLVRGDPLRLSRLLTNLMDNAERHAVAEITVTVRAAGDVAVLEVLDDGSGVAVEDREAVFQRFARLKDACDRDAGGTGLGLPIARQIARMHQGTLTLEDSSSGARFVLRLPRWFRGPGD